MRDRRRVGITIFLLVVSAAAIAVLSPSGSTDSNTVAVTSDTSAPGTAGLRVFLDPETGDVVDNTDPSAVLQLDAEMENALRHDTEGLANVKHANGAVSINLDERYQEASIVIIDENGKRTICSSNAADIEKALTGNTSTTAEVQ